MIIDRSIGSRRTFRHFAEHWCSDLMQRREFCEKRSQKSKDERKDRVRKRPHRILTHTISDIKENAVICCLLLFFAVVLIFLRQIEYKTVDVFSLPCFRSSFAHFYQVGITSESITERFLWDKFSPSLADRFIELSCHAAYPREKKLGLWITKMMFIRTDPVLTDWQHRIVFNHKLSLVTIQSMLNLQIGTGS